jgi:uncharacterized protein (DUF488 family)
VALPKIYTIGYEGAAVEDLIATLKQAQVSRVLDVREQPYSQRPEFSSGAIEAALAGYGILYTHIRELGNPPAGREAARIGHAAAFREIFATHLASKGGQAGLARALALAAAEPVCLFCLEKAPNRCHRSMVTAKMHEASGQEIVHLRVMRKIGHPAQIAFDF